MLKGELLVLSSHALKNATFMLSNPHTSIQLFGLELAQEDSCRLVKKTRRQEDNSEMCRSDLCL